MEGAAEYSLVHEMADGTRVFLHWRWGGDLARDEEAVWESAEACVGLFKKCPDVP